jgi:dienelactone hydrolase
MKAPLLILSVLFSCGLQATDPVKPAVGSEIFTNHPPARIVSLEGASLPSGNPIDSATGWVTKFKAPALLLFPTKAAKPKGTILLFPGGGYALLEMIREGYNTASFLNKCGYDVALLEYPINHNPDIDTRDKALEAALSACRLIRSDGSSLGLHTSRFCIMGYSAGGYLAARTVQYLSDANQPDDLILIYPAYLEECPVGSQMLVVRPPGKPKHLFAIFGATDRKNWIAGFENYQKAWVASRGMASFHLLPATGHGFGLVEEGEEGKSGEQGEGKATIWQEMLKKVL